jgi:hypothetical protein
LSAVKKNARFDRVVLLIVRVGKEGLWSLLILKRLVLRTLHSHLERSTLLMGSLGSEGADLEERLAGVEQSSLAGHYSDLERSPGGVLRM